MSDELVHTKLLPPARRPDLLLRPRLLELLYDLLDYKLILVVAPAGYGKTSLLAELAHQGELPICWYTLHEAEREAERFFAYFIAAITQHFPGFGERARALLQSPSGELQPERLAGTLVNEIHEQIREHFVLVLDDYHLVDSNPRINAFINHFVTLVAENCHLVLVTRTLPTLPDLPRMVAHSQVGGLGSRELAFQPSEIQTLMLQNYQRSLSDTAALDLARQTKGWITGLLLSAQQAGKEMTHQVDLHDCLEPILLAEPPPVQEFLLRTSLPSLTLTIQALGRALVLRDGAPLSGPEWQGQKRVRELFFCLLAHPKGLSREALGELLWPDLEKFHIPFKNTIYRLRYVLGTEMILLEDGLYHFRWESDYEYDVERFWEHMEKARRAPSPEAQATAYEAAAELYHGPYLPDTEESWVHVEREQLWQGYVEAALFLAEHYLHNKVPQQALFYCHRILADDPYLEEAHRLAMHVHAMMGNLGAVARQFQRCAEVLKAEFGISPSDQTQELYRQLTMR